MKGNKNEVAVAVVEEPVNVRETIKLWVHRLVRMCSFQLQILLICGLVKGTFESPETMFRALCLQMLILVYAYSLSNQRDARNGDLVFYVVSSVIGFVCYFYMAAKLFPLILECLV
ncbi:hypothetical protein CASFOL_020665 [Castilleja foliolosa]|uniref:Uncharacterized protein n=1 Tax=Castilleja foliolosa TaxID=1961234 RepID=A0ABD3D1I3_9LAMI